jgi:hypothetical protein
MALSQKQALTALPSPVQSMTYRQMPPTTLAEAEITKIDIVKKYKSSTYKENS